MTERDEFSVYWWDAAQNCHEELRFVGAEAAVRAAKRLTEGPAAQAGMVARVIITDGADYCNFEWKHGRITWDPREHAD
jgi:hypothetical protein